jgi:hypothetical protein
MMSGLRADLGWPIRSGTDKSLLPHGFQAVVVYGFAVTGGRGIGSQNLKKRPDNQSPDPPASRSCRLEKNAAAETQAKTELLGSFPTHYTSMGQSLTLSPSLP